MATELTAARLLAESRPLAAVGQRMRLISARLRGAPYVVNPLRGSATEPEVFVSAVNGFDCVTFIESVLALAVSRRAAEFPERLRELRYRDGEVSWRQRLHYSTDWAKYHVRRGRLEDLTRGEATETKRRTLAMVPGLPAKQTSFRYLPKKKLNWASRRVDDGDLIFFVSTRPKLDVFHTGLLFREGGGVVLRHAARSRGGVVEQELGEFVRVNRMPGFIIVRPRENGW